MSDLQQTIEQAFENRAEINPANVDAEVRHAVQAAIDLLDSGQQRVAQPVADGWQVNEWLKKAVLLSFRIRENQIMPGGFTQYFDKVDSKFDGCSHEQHVASGVRVVPPAVARKGSYVAPGVVMMPSFVNIGAYVDSARADLGRPSRRQALAAARSASRLADRRWSARQWYPSCR